MAWATSAVTAAFDQPANLDVARLLGVFNLLPVEIRALDPANKTSRIRFQEFDLTGPYFPGHFKGDRVTLCVRPDQLSAGPRDSRADGNRIPVQLLHTTEKPQVVRLEFAGGISVEMPRAEYERQKHNRDWAVEFPASVLKVL